MIKRIHTKEWKEAASIRMSGKNNPMFGKPSPKKGTKLSNETRKKMSESQKGISRPHTLEQKIRMSEIAKEKGYGKWMTGKHHTQEVCQKMNLDRKGIRRPNSFILKRMGANNPSWKGGITPERNKIRNCIEYGLWKNSVLARDNWTCQKTKVRGGILRCHHIQNFSQYPELRFAIDNGIVLSKDSHDEFHKIYGKQNNTREQLEEYLNR